MAGARVLTEPGSSDVIVATSFPASDFSPVSARIGHMNRHDLVYPLWDPSPGRRSERALLQLSGSTARRLGRRPGRADTPDRCQGLSDAPKRADHQGPNAVLGAAGSAWDYRVGSVVAPRHPQGPRIGPLTRRVTGRLGRVSSAMGPEVPADGSSSPVDPILGPPTQHRRHSRRWTPPDAHRPDRCLSAVRSPRSNTHPASGPRANYRSDE